MFAIIKSGGKQYRVVPGDIIRLEYLGLKKGEEVTFNQVLMLQNEKIYEIGTPNIESALVKGQILENKNDNKIIVFKKRRRHNSRRLNGHKRLLSIVKIEKISYKGNVLVGPEYKIKKTKTASKKINIVNEKEKVSKKENRDGD